MCWSGSQSVAWVGSLFSQCLVLEIYQETFLTLRRSHRASVLLPERTLSAAASGNPSPSAVALAVDIQKICVLLSCLRDVETEVAQPGLVLWSFWSPLQGEKGCFQSSNGAFFCDLLSANARVPDTLLLEMFCWSLIRIGWSYVPQI